MLKPAIISIVALLIFSSFIGYNYSNNEKEDIKLEIPNDAPFSFSYDMNVKTFSTLENKNDIDKLKPHLRFQFVPQETKMRVNGFLSEEGDPNFTIDILEKSKNKWIHTSNINPQQKPELKKIVVRGNKLASYDSRGEEITSYQNDAEPHTEMVNNLRKNIDPQTLYQKFISDAIDDGWDVKHIENTIRMAKSEKDKETIMFMDKKSSLPKLSKVITEKEIIVTTYKYECIDGKYVLVLQKTKVKMEYDGVPVEFNSLTSIDNVNF